MISVGSFQIAESECSDVIISRKPLMMKIIARSDEKNFRVGDIWRTALICQVNGKSCARNFHPSK
ncbi:hypothetical protein ACRAVF_27300 [Bradyrhizobium oligotrophicum S58]